MKVRSAIGTFTNEIGKKKTKMFKILENLMAERRTYENQLLSEVLLQYLPNDESEEYRERLGLKKDSNQSREIEPVATLIADNVQLDKFMKLSTLKGFIPSPKKRTETMKDKNN
jgi:hypothetical protein